MANYRQAIAPQDIRAAEGEDEDELQKKIEEHQGEVKSYVDPQKLEWFGEELQLKRNCNNIKIGFININKAAFCINKILGVKLNPGNKEMICVKVGLSKNGAILAFKLAEKGLFAHKDKRTGALRIYSRPLNKLLFEKGWPESTRVPAEWDERSQMVVARRPEEAKPNAYTKRK